MPLIIYRRSTAPQARVLGQCEVINYVLTPVIYFVVLDVILLPFVLL